MTLQPDPRVTYAFSDPPEDDIRARKHRLVHETKRVIETIVACLDGEG